MSRFAGGVPLVGVGVMLLCAISMAAVSALLAYWVSPVVVASLPLVVVAFWVIQRYRVGALVLLLLCLPLGRLTFAEVVSPVTVLAAVVLVVWLWRVLSGSVRIEFSHMQLPVAAFLLWGIAGIYGALDVGNAIKVLSIFVMGASVYLVTSQTIRSPEEAHRVLWAAAVAVAITALYAVVAGFVGSLSDVQADEGGEAYARFAGIFGHPNVLGGFLALAIPSMVALVASEGVWWRRLSGCLLVIAAMAGLVLTYSRGAWLGGGVGLLILLPVLKRGFWLILGAVLLGPVLVGMATSADDLLARLESIAAAGSDPALMSRLEIWGIAFRLVAEHPLLGVGLGNFQAAYGKLMVPDLPLLTYPLELPEHAHNLFLNLAVEVGLVGVSAFAWLLAVAFLRARQIKRFADWRVGVWGMGLAAGLVALSVQALVDVVVYQGFVAILFFTYLGIMDSLRRFGGSQVEYEPALSHAARTPTPGTAERSTPTTGEVRSNRAWLTRRIADG
jgi:putative inorganic carbon (hco3(-)) transporter